MSSYQATMLAINDVINIGLAVLATLFTVGIFLHGWYVRRHCDHSFGAVRTTDNRALCKECGKDLGDYRTYMQGESK